MRSVDQAHAQMTTLVRVHAASDLRRAAVDTDSFRNYLERRFRLAGFLGPEELVKSQRPSREAVCGMTVAVSAYYSINLYFPGYPKPLTRVADLRAFMGHREGMSVVEFTQHLLAHREKVVERLLWLAGQMLSRLDLQIATVTSALPHMRASDLRALMGITASNAEGARSAIRYEPASSVAFELPAGNAGAGPDRAQAGAPVQTVASAEASAGLERQCRLLEEQLADLRRENGDLVTTAERRRLAIQRLDGDLHIVRKRLSGLEASARAHSASSQDAGSGVDWVPESWDDLETFAARYLSPSVVLMPKAIRTARNSVFENIPLAYRVLRMLADDYVPMRRGEAGARQRYEARLVQLRLDLGPTGSAVEQFRWRAGYNASFENRRYPLDMHVQGSSSRDPRQCFRLYFHYREEDGLLLVGSFPSHLDNFLS